MDWWSFILLALAVFSVWKLLAEDVILEKPRDWFLRTVKDKYIETLLLCPWCSGFWLAGIALTLYCLTTSWLNWFGFIVTWFALRAVVGIIAHFTVEE